MPRASSSSEDDDDDDDDDGGGGDDDDDDDDERASDGAMLTFGSGSAGALGHGNTHYVLTPTPVGALRGHAIRADGAGSSPRARLRPPGAPKAALRQLIAPGVRLDTRPGVSKLDRRRRVLVRSARL